MKLTKEQLDELTGGCKTPRRGIALFQMLQHMINQSLEAEMDAHLGMSRFLQPPRGWRK